MWFDNEFDRIFRRLSDRFFDMDDDFEQMWRYARTEPYLYGYTLAVGSNGGSFARQYHNPISGIAATDIREPFIDEVVDKDNRTLKLIAEMPGVDKNDIKVTIEDKYAKISADSGTRKYDTRIPLKYNIDENSTKATYANGILEVSLKLVDEQPKGKIISVE